jgi:DNA-directed RNA polymerase subunit RPC12/RpoP
MSEVKMRSNCGECGAELEESPSLPTEERIPCPACGSIKRAIQVSISESVTIREMLGMKGKRQGEKKPFIESVSGDDLHRKTGKWMKLTRMIDRENNQYKEEVKDPATGDTVHRCEEPLSDHKGHGSAKKPKQ